jgi:hypothetical protein
MDAATDKLMFRLSNEGDLARPPGCIVNLSDAHSEEGALDEAGAGAFHTSEIGTDHRGCLSVISEDAVGATTGAINVCGSSAG